MDSGILLVRQICSLVLMGLAGYWLYRARIISHEESKGLSVVCVYVLVPCSLLASFQTKINPERMTGFVYATVTVIIIHAVFFAVMELLKKIYPMSGIESASVIYSNAGNLIIPLVTGVFGTEYVFYTSAYLFVQNALIWSHAQRLIGGSSRMSWKKIFLHPCILSIFAGLICFFSGWSLPGIVYTACSGLAACMGPVSMMTIGIMIAEIDLKEIFLNRRIYAVVGLRLLVYPVLAMGVIFFVRKLFPGQVDPVVCMVVLMGACGPAATSLTQMAQMFDNAPGYTSSINVLSTFGSIVTMPVIVTAARMILWKL